MLYFDIVSLFARNKGIFDIIENYFYDYSLCSIVVLYSQE